jgi:hypothetical protein
MTYGFSPENWPAFEHELRARGIAVADIEKLELRPAGARDDADATGTRVTVTLRSGRVDTWTQDPPRPTTW